MVSRLHALLVALLLCCCGLLAPAAASPDRTAPGMQADAAATERAIDRFSVSDPMTQGQAESAADGPGLLAATRAEGLARFELDSSRPVVVVFGGGHGARSLNTAALEAFAARETPFSLLHVAGEHDVARVR
ncbi:MAG: hypothetical protein Q8L12_11495, partial [Methylibium sp.]|nr:hypothetical protein [Methylibium sp.]